MDETKIVDCVAVFKAAVAQQAGTARDVLMGQAYAALRSLTPDEEREATTRSVRLALTDKETAL